ncbi:hypothetical protein [Streptomyces sp. NPDC059552]|uniref:hypothetical protein n=1 Tax=Streptomyces sp. NPDC059552 TaxID=3346862 RepID=UPI003680DFAD
MGSTDVHAAEALRAWGGRPGSADRIATALVGRLADGPDDLPARRRLTQALADVPGVTAARALAELAHDEDPAVALTAAYLLTLREARDPD